MIILVSVVAQIGPKGSCAVHMNRPQPATSVGYSIYLKKNYLPKPSSSYLRDAGEVPTPYFNPLHSWH